MKEYPKNKNYIVYEDGRIYSKRVNKFLKPKKNWDGYYRIQIWEHNKVKMTSWHRIIAETFIPNPENKPVVNHINGDKKDNRVENLEWVTQKENIQHAWKTGLSKSQINNPKLSKAVDLYDLFFQNKTTYPSTMEIERILGIHHSLVSKVCKGNGKYGHLLDGEYYAYYHSDTSND